MSQESRMLFANFNQDFSCVVFYTTRQSYTTNILFRCMSVGSRKGYSITNCDPFGRVYTQSAFRPFPYVLVLTNVHASQTMDPVQLSKCFSARR